MSIQHQSRSASLSLDSATHVPADQAIKPLRDQIIIEPLEVDHQTKLIVIEETKPVRGIVKAVGPGHYPKQYDHPDKAKRTKTWEGTSFLPTQIKVGDIVHLGSPQGQRGYSFQSLWWGDKIHLVCREADIVGVESND